MNVVRQGLLDLRRIGLHRTGVEQRFSRRDDPFCERAKRADQVGPGIDLILAADGHNVGFGSALDCNGDAVAFDEETPIVGGGGGDFLQFEVATEIEGEFLKTSNELLRRHFRGGFLSKSQVTCRVSAHLLQKLQIPSAGLRRGIGSLEDLDDADTGFVPEDRPEDVQVRRGRGELRIFPGSIEAALTGAEDLIEKRRILLARLLVFEELRFFKVQLVGQPNLPVFFQQPNHTGLGSHGQDDPAEEFRVENLIGYGGAGEFFDLAG